MNEGMLPEAIDRAAARVILERAETVAVGPGRLGSGGVAGAMVWDAAAGIGQADLFAAFWVFDFGKIEWLTGFLCDPDVTRLFELLANPPEDEEEPEELFARASMNTLEGNVASY